MAEMCREQGPEMVETTLTTLSGDPDEIFRGIREANHHRGGLKCRKLFSVRPDFFSGVVAEARRLSDLFQPSEVIGRGHVTNWTEPFGRVVQYSLLNRSGRFDDFSVDHDSRYDDKAFHHGAEYPYLDQFIRAFPSATNMRLNVLGPGSGLSPHEEHTVLYGEDGTARVRVRFHLPLVTNPESQVLLDGDLFHLAEGVIFYFNNGCVHSARNLGDTGRYHLVWDMMFTPATFQLMFGDFQVPPFLSRLAGDELQCEVAGREPVGRYAISGPGKTLYDQLDLDAMNVHPSAFHDMYNDAVYFRERHCRFAFSDPTAPPLF